MVGILDDDIVIGGYTLTTKLFAEQIATIETARNESTQNLMLSENRSRLKLSGKEEDFEDRLRETSGNFIMSGAYLLDCIEYNYLKAEKKIGLRFFTLVIGETAGVYLIFF